ncbi:MAG: SLC13 family permease [Candidatus Gygaella obscura]|nr:SLC13 family permease [Candidatus Gygaella obscura]
MDIKLLNIIIFVTAYFFVVLFIKKRTFVSVLAVLILLFTGCLSLKDAFFSVNWNVLGIFVGMLFIADIFMESRVPAYLAEIIVNRSKNISYAILFICALTGILSAFLENVATVMIIAPIALAMAKKLNFNPIKMMIAIAISSNLQGAATLVGDPPSMLLGGFAKMNFAHFFFYQGKPSIFFAVELGALVSFVVLYFVFKSHQQKFSSLPLEKVNSWVPTGILVILIILLALTSFIDLEFSYMAGALCMVFALVSLAYKKFFLKKGILENIKGLDWNTLLFLLAIFILVGSLGINGWIDIISLKISGIIGTNILLGFVLLIVFSVIFSAFIDNVPFLAAMLPVAIGISDKLNMNPTLFLFALLIGASLGGNITPIGASANIVACGILKKEGYSVSFKKFVSIGLPFTIAATLAASVFVWFVWR